MNTSRKPDESDKQRGRELARLRRARGMTQSQLSQMLGISMQQLGKYERGQNRMPIGRHGLAMEVLGGARELQEDAARFAGSIDEKAELKRLLTRIEADLARCKQIAASL